MSDLSQRSDDTGVGLGREGGALQRGGEGGIIIIEPPSENSKKGLFHRHPKTPSSPARLLTSVSGDQSDWTINSSHMTSMDRDRAEESVSDSQLDASSSRHHHRCYSGDTSLRRGRPNTVKSGLPSPRHKRLSVEQDLTGCKDTSKRGATFVSPVKCEMFDCGPGAFDTSPIPSVAPDAATRDDLLPPGSTTELETPQIDTEHVDNVTMEIDESSSNVDQLPLDHDNAFIQDSILCVETVPAVALETTCLETTSELDHIEMTSVPVKDAVMEHVEAAPSSDNIGNSAPMDAMSPPPHQNDVDTASCSGHDVVDSKLTSEMKAEPSLIHLTTDHSDSGRSSPTEGADSKNDTPSTLHTQSSDASLDSAVCLSSDTASVDSVVCLSSDSTSIDSVMCVTSDAASTDSSVTDASLNTPLVGDSRDKSQSTGSVTSCDSGIGLGSVQQGQVKPCSLQCGDTVHLVVHTRHDDQRQPDVLTGKDNTSHNGHHTKTHTVAKSPNRCRPESVDRYWSPLRFPNSPLRRPRRGASPVRIPTIFAKADQEAARYRELAKSVLRSGASPRRSRHPSLPISTTLLRTNAVAAARCQLALAEGSTGVKTTPRIDTLAGHTPMRVGRNSADVMDEFTRVPLRESSSLNREECMSVASKMLNTDDLTSTTPRIKPPLMAGSQKLFTPGVSMTTPHRRCNSPGKPVKRLQGSCSPSSPRGRFGRSPRRYKKSPVKPTTTYSPGTTPSGLPAHVTDWNV